MLSPLLAYFTPQMLRAVPGAEQFADLVPTPTTADALSQYIKNISQFGFILAILLGMGAVAGEKERGTASLILSKPMARGAFVTSKFIAQMTVYLLGFLLALLGAYFYTLVLFGEIDFSALVLITLLLFAWLLPYVTVTLLGSVLAGSTSAAAGIALAGAVVLLISSNVPQIGALMPGALVGWAGQLGIGNVPPAPNGGALAVIAVLTVVGLIAGIAVFERQEL
jgi:ABC-2 type transport system permease protein